MNKLAVISLSSYTAASKVCPMGSFCVESMFRMSFVIDDLKFSALVIKAIFSFDVALSILFFIAEETVFSLSRIVSEFVALWSLVS